MMSYTWYFEVLMIAAMRGACVQQVSACIKTSEHAIARGAFSVRHWLVASSTLAALGDGALISPIWQGGSSRYVLLQLEHGTC